MAGGRIIKGKYQIIREIGRGAMGIVYEVRHEELGSTLALKQLQLNLENNPDIARRFRHEARMMARLQHANIVRVWDIDSEPDFGTFLVMEFINGPDLGKILRARRLTYPEVLRIGGAVASALHAAHREGLVHRDVKPANILIEEYSMRAVVTDFGIAKQMKGEGEDSTVGTVGFLGTYRYSSPEQIRSERDVSIDGRADIYSLGVVLYEMFSGKKFLEGMSEGQITHLVGFHADWRPTLQYSEPPPEDFRVLIERCLVRNRDERIADAGEVARCIESCLRWADDAQRPAAHAVPPPHAAEPAADPETAITQSPIQPEAPRPDPRVLAEIEQLQGTLAAEVSQLRDLHQEWSVIGASPVEGNGRATEDLSQKLEDIEALKEAADLASARAALDEVRLEIAALREQHLAGLREAVDARLNGVHEQWRALTQRAGDFVTPDQVGTVESLFDAARRALATDDRQAALRGAAEGQRLLEEVQASAHERCATSVTQALANARTQLQQLRERSPRLASELPLDLDAVEDEVRTALSAGQLREAGNRAQAALSTITAAIAQEMIERQAAQRATLELELRALLARAAEAPADIAGEARRQTQALLDAPPADAASALAAMEEARASLTTRLDEAAAFATADAARSAAEAGQQRVVDLGPSWRQRRRATTVMDSAAAAFKKRQWVAARDAYAEAMQALAALEQELTAERVSQQVDAARRQLDELLSSLDLEAANALAPEECARADTLRTEATAAAQRGDGAAAVAAYENAATAYRAVGEQVSEQLSAQYATARQGLRELIDGAATAPDALVRDEHSAAAALLAAPQPANLNAALAEIDRVRVNLETALDALPSFTAAHERHAAADTRHKRVHALGLPRRRLTEADRLMKAAAAALDRRQWTVARDTYEQADAALAALEEAERRQQPAAAVAATPSEVAAPSSPYRWVGGAALAAGLASVAAWLLYPSTPTEQSVRPQPTVAARATAAVQSKPPPPAAVPPRIAKAFPPSDTVTVREGAQQPFSVVVDGAAPNEQPPIEWKLDDRVVASNVAQWDYKPNYQEGRDAARTLAVILGNGQGPDQTHTWQVKVDDVNRGPILRDASPKAGSRVTAKIGDTLNFRVTAADDDNDPMQYAWTVDGKPAGTNAPELKLPVTAENQLVSVVVSDGKDSTPADWRVVASIPSLKLEFSPARLDTLRFNEPREFALAAPPGTSAASLQYAWSVDGQKVSDTPKFVLKDYTPAMIRDSPVVIAATARDDQGRSFSHEWKPRVTPPPPELKASSPPADRAVDAEPSRPQTFTMEANAPLGAQRFTYIYEVDGRPAARDGDNRFTFTPTDDNSHEVAGYVEDNYRQTSRQRVLWKLQAGSIVKRVQDWLKQYESAWNAKDAATIGRLRGLKPDETQKLQDSFKEKKDLRVTFTGLKTEKLDASRAKASYTRLDEWVGKDGEPVTRSRAVEQTFRLAGNVLQEAGESQ